MKAQIDLLFADIFIRRCLLAFVIMLILFAAIYILKMQSLPPQLPLFYSLPRGSEQLGSPLTFLLLPALSIFITICNTIVSIFLYKHEPLLARVLSFVGVFSVFLLLITFIRIVILVT
jgi:hypothetical protein